MFRTPSEKRSESFDDFGGLEDVLARARELIRAADRDSRHMLRDLRVKEQSRDVLARQG